MPSFALRWKTMLKTIRPRASRWRLLGAATVLLTLAVTAGWYGLVHPWAEAEIGRRLNRVVYIDALYPGGGGLVARGVELFGRPPFQAEPVAYVDRLEIRLGGSRGMFSPDQIAVDGVEVNLLITPTADNWRGDLSANARAAATATPAPPARSAHHQVPVVVRRVRLAGVVQLPTGQKMAFRAPRLDVRRDETAPLSLEIEGLVFELAGGATARIPRLTVETTHDGQALVSGRDIAVWVPGAAPILDRVKLDGAWRRGGWDVNLMVGEADNPDPTSPFVLATARLGANGLTVDVDADHLSLAGLAPLLDGSGADVSRARAKFKFNLNFDTDHDAIPWRSQLAITDLTWRHPALSTTSWQRVALSGDLNGELALAGDPHVTVRQGTLDLMGVPLLVSGSTTLSGHPVGMVTVSSPAEGVDCKHLLESTPRGLRPALDGMKLAGNMKFSVALGFDASNWEQTGLDVQLPSVCDVLAEPDLIARSRAVLISGGPGVLAHRPDLPVGTDHEGFTALRRMPPHLVGAFLTAEDSAFYEHNGFQVDMIRRALAYNLERGQLMRGASTITQQLTKNLFLTHDRTIARKLAETILAWRVNAVVPKDRVLELYLNVIELGPDIRGVSRASQVYFGKTLTELGPLESAHLASLPPNPRGFARRFRDGRVDEGWLHRLYDLLGMMKRRGHISGAEVTAARARRLRLRKI